MNTRSPALALTLAAALLLASCGSDSKPAPAGLLGSSPTTSSASATPRASATAAPANTPAPTSNPKPTDTPKLAATAALAAATQVPATAIPATPVPPTATTNPAPTAVPPTAVPPTVKPAPTVSPDPPGVTALCKDGSYSYSKTASGTCSSHGGVSRWINHP